MKIIPGHDWNLTPAQAVSLQQDLTARLRPGPRPQPLSLVAGVDAAYSPGDGLIVGAAVIWEVGRGRVIEEAVAVAEAAFPYRSGLLTFREGPVLLKALTRLKNEPGVAMATISGKSCLVASAVFSPSTTRTRASGRAARRSRP